MDYRYFLIEVYHRNIFRLILIVFVCPFIRGKLILLIVRYLAMLSGERVSDRGISEEAARWNLLGTWLMCRSLNENS